MGPSRDTNSEAVELVFERLKEYFDGMHRYKKNHPLCGSCTVDQEANATIGKDKSASKFGSVSEIYKDYYDYSPTASPSDCPIVRAMAITATNMTDAIHR